MAERGLHAPAWLEELLRTNRPPVPWPDVVRFAVTIPAPLALSLLISGALHDPAAVGAGIFATTGALASTLAPQPGPLRDQLRRLVSALGLGGIGLAIGQYATGGGWQPVLVIAAIAAGAALLSSINAVLSLGSLQLLVYAAMSSGLRAPLPAWQEICFFLAGGAWATVTVLVEWVFRRGDPDRAAVGAVFTALAGLLEASGTEGADDARRALTVALNQGYDRVIRSRSLLGGRSGELAELAGVLNSTQPLVEAAVALARSGESADPEDLAAVRALASAVTGGRPLTEERPPALEHGHHAARAVRHGVRLAWNVVGDPEERAGAAVPRTETDLRSRLRDLADRTIGSAESRSFAVRLALCMAIGEVLRQYLPLQRPYWVLLTVAIVLKPDFGSVFTRAVQRGIGTLIGVVIGSALLTALPHNGWILVAMAVAAGVLPWARGANYGVLSTFLTPLVIFLLDLATPAGSGLITARLIDTLIGCGIVLVVGYLLWPQTWRAPLDEALRSAALSLDAFVEAAFTGDSTQRRRARRRNYRALTELQTQLQRRLAEPPPISTRAAAWWPVIVQLERTSDAVTEAVIATRGGEPAPDLAQVAVLRRAIRQLEEDVRAHRVSGKDAYDDAEIMADGVLAPVAREVDTARRLVRETAPGGRAATVDAED